MLGNVSLVVLTLLLLQLLVAAAWLLGSRKLVLPARAARHWSGFALVGSLALALFLARGAAPDELVFGLAATTAVASLLLMRRGALVSLRLPLHDAEAGAVLIFIGFSAIGSAFLPAPQAAALLIGLTCLALVWVLARTAAQGYGVMRVEFGDATAFALLSPLVAGCALFALRALVSLVEPELARVQAGPTLQIESPFNVAVAMLLLLLCLLVHGSLAATLMLRQVGQLRIQSQRDALTGLYNRAEWTRQLAAQHRWLGRYGDPFAVLMIDIDLFKKVNDTYGHAAGDAVLVAVAQVLLASARDLDVVGRLGGEEFGVLLPRTEPVAARRAAERLRQMLADAETHWKQQPLRVTVSVGVALATDADESPEQLVERADLALYQAKRAGRNRVVVARMAS